MTTFEYLPVPAADLARIRRTGHDDHGNPLVPQLSEAGLPLRCCLRVSTEGERIALIAYRPSALGGPYAEIGPVFVHTNDCGGPESTTSFPSDFTNRRAVLRPYDAGGRLMDGVLAGPGESETLLKQLFTDPGVAVVHVRNVIAGCWNFSVRRAS
ncbi:MAG TPA: DUF1203 domain-containing protein [Kribbellaceae bacterium]